jgi:hypothetical protein
VVSVAPRYIYSRARSGEDIWKAHIMSPTDHLVRMIILYS